MNGMAFGFASTSAPQPQGTSAPSFKSHQELKTALHRDLLNKIDLERLTSLQDVRARTQVQNVIYDRSEEHTSELQSQSNLVCRLLLEKKKQVKQSYSIRPQQHRATIHNAFMTLFLMQH